MPFPVDSVFIDRAAMQLGIRLPLSYVNFIRLSNGGEIGAAGDAWQLFPILDESEKSRIKRTCNHIVRETKIAREWVSFPQNGVAIASNGTGDLLVYIPTDLHGLANQVYRWDHESGDLTEVAGDFGELTAL